jgi:hypothetical protein
MSLPAVVAVEALATNGLCTIAALLQGVSVPCVVWPAAAAPLSCCWVRALLIFCLL